MFSRYDPSETPSAGTNNPRLPVGLQQKAPTATVGAKDIDIGVGPSGQKEPKPAEVALRHEGLAGERKQESSTHDDDTLHKVAAVSEAEQAERTQDVEHLILRISRHEIVP